MVECKQSRVPSNGVDFEALEIHIKEIGHGDVGYQLLLVRLASLDALLRRTSPGSALRLTRFGSGIDLCAGLEPGGSAVVDTFLRRYPETLRLMGSAAAMQYLDGGSDACSDEEPLWP
jgi:hypothetical protein